MGGFLLRKAGAALIVVFLSSIVVFIGIRALPGDPAVALGAENRDPAVMAAIRHSYGLDKPLPVQYVKWIGKALRGDLGLDARQLPVGDGAEGIGRAIEPGRDDIDRAAGTDGSPGIHRRTRPA